MDTSGWHRKVSRRTVLKVGAAGIAGSTLGLLVGVSRSPRRVSVSPPSSLPDIQFDIGDFIGPEETLDGTTFRFGPVFTLFLTARMSERPTLQDQAILADALDTIESVYPFSPKGVFTIVGYGAPYFQRLPDRVVAEHVPTLLEDPGRFALEEALPGPTDVSPHNPYVRKRAFNVPVLIEGNDLLFSIRSDDLEIAQDVAGWLAGSNRLQGRTLSSPGLPQLLFDRPRVMFTQRG